MGHAAHALPALQSGLPPNLSSDNISPKIWPLSFSLSPYLLSPREGRAPTFPGPYQGSCVGFCWCSNHATTTLLEAGEGRVAKWSCSALPCLFTHSPCFCEPYPQMRTAARRRRRLRISALDPCSSERPRKGSMRGGIHRLLFF